MNFKNLLLRLLIAALLASAVIGIFVFLVGGFGETTFQLLFTTLSIGGYCLTGLSCSIIYSKLEFRTLSTIGMIISALALSLTVLGIWVFNRFEGFWQLTIVFGILSLGMAHVCLLLRVERKSVYVGRITAMTIFVIGMVALMLIKATLTKFSEGEFYFRMLGVLAILDILGTIGIPLVNRLAK